MVYDGDLLFNQPKLIYQFLLAQKTRCFSHPTGVKPKGNDLYPFLSSFFKVRFSTHELFKVGKDSKSAQCPTLTDGQSGLPRDEAVAIQVIVGTAACRT